MFARRSRGLLSLQWGFAVGSIRRESGERARKRQAAKQVARVAIESLEERQLLTGTPFYYAAISDYGINDVSSGVEAAVASMVRNWDGEGDALAAIITAGDNRQQRHDGWTYDMVVAGENDEYYADFVDERRIYPTPGNHDWGNGDGYAYPANLSEYRTYFHNSNPSLYPPGSPDYYDVVPAVNGIPGPVHFFMLSVEVNEPGSYGPQSAQAKWLREQLATSTSPWNIVVMHEPAYASCNRNGSTDWLNRHWSNPELQWPFKDWGADVVLQGHNHWYELDAAPGDVPYFTIGVGGAGFGTPSGTKAPGWQSGYEYSGPTYHGAQYITADDTTLNLALRTTNNPNSNRNSYSLPARSQPVVSIRASDPDANESGDPGALLFA